ncbi:hypothetical protein F4781DRAFT_126637 [Annulohypoxylon bovei var. microspora]|nr:hypothetical protein F4781DRAFT_126637 [Annulohypoxylon bovei var. microspora]
MLRVSFLSEWFTNLEEFDRLNDEVTPCSLIGLFTRLYSMERNDEPIEACSTVVKVLDFAHGRLDAIDILK